jgi:hypothetical protein
METAWALCEGWRGAQDPKPDVKPGPHAPLPPCPQGKDRMPGPCYSPDRIPSHEKGRRDIIMTSSTPAT